MKPRAVIALCNPTACGEFVQQVQRRTEGSKEQRPAVAQLSNIDMLAQFERVGGSGVVGSPFAQVMPDPRRTSLPIVEGLKHAKSMTRQRVKEAMEGLGTVNRLAQRALQRLVQRGDPRRQRAGPHRPRQQRAGRRGVARLAGLHADHRRGRHRRPRRQAARLHGGRLLAHRAERYVRDAGTYLESMERLDRTSAVD